MRLSIVTFLILFSSLSFAYVENVTHGYPNCMACHVSPSGGGVLNDYGRSLSRELMSTWGWAGSEQALFGAVKEHDNFRAGGDIRYIQTQTENSDFKQGKQFLMQRNLEVALRHKTVSIVGTLGTLEGPEGTPKKGDFISERHYILWDTSDQTHLRVGKFRIPFGLYDPNHTRVTKQPLGFGSYTESYNMEFTKFTDEYELFVVAAAGRLDLARDTRSERSFSATYAGYIGEKGKVGGSLLTGESGEMRRNLASVFTVLPVRKHGTFKAEIDYQKSTLTTAPDKVRDLVAAFAFYGMTVTKGIMPYAFAEHLQTELADNKTQQTSPGLGVQFLPIPHLELQAEYKHQVLQSDPGKPNDIFFFLFHFYI